MLREGITARRPIFLYSLSDELRTQCTSSEHFRFWS
jgi:hypothetical protein